MAPSKKSKNQLRRERLKSKKNDDSSADSTNKDSLKAAIDSKSTLNDGITIENHTSGRQTTDDNSKIFTSELDQILEKPDFAQFRHIFDKFHTDHLDNEDTSKGDIIESDNEDIKDLIASDTENNDNGNTKVSKKKLRKANKIPLAELKALTNHPELVQWYDVDAADPVLVVELKAHKNYVPVPTHWQHKRDYLSGKRGFEKSAFTLPSYISETGITDMRDTTKEDDKSLKQLSRERVQPKMNRLDMDYQKLHDAFFKFQSKPRLYEYGDLYYEGRETEEVDYSHFRPGVISDDLRNALDVPKGAPLPWVQKFQQFGPPPSYPDLRIPGYNAPLDDDGTTDETSTLPADVEVEPFGKLISYGDSEEEEEEEVEEEEESEEGEGGEQIEESAEEEDDVVVVEETELQSRLSHEEKPIQYDAEVEDSSSVDANDEDEEDVPLAEVSIQNQENDIEPKKLYEILKEKVQSDNGFLASNRTYEISNQVKRKQDETDGHSIQKKAKSASGDNLIGNVVDGGKDEDDDDDDEEEETNEKFKF